MKLLLPNDHQINLPGGNFFATTKSVDVNIIPNILCVVTVKRFGW